MDKNSRILVIHPTYNEIENISLIVPKVLEKDPRIHVLIVDDNSPDGTGLEADNMASKDPRINVLHRTEKAGLGKAYIAGFKWALENNFDYMFEMDADFSHNPNYLPDFLEAIQHADLVIGSRYINGVNVVNWPMSRLLLSYFGNLYARIVTGMSIKDATGGFKCFSRKVLEAIDLDSVSSSGYSFQIEMNYYVWKKKFNIKEIPIIFTDRERGVSKMSTSIAKEALLLLWRLKFGTIFKNK